MGLCLPCLGGAAEDVVETPDPELKRRQLAEAAEKRQMEASSRGIKNPSSVEQKKKKKDEAERMASNLDPPGGGGGLRTYGNFFNDFRWDRALRDLSQQGAEPHRHTNPEKMN